MLDYGPDARGGPDAGGGPDFHLHTTLAPLVASISTYL